MGRDDIFGVDGLVSLDEEKLIAVNGGADLGAEVAELDMAKKHHKKKKHFVNPCPKTC